MVWLYNESYYNHVNKKLKPESRGNLKTNQSTLSDIYISRICSINPYQEISAKLKSEYIQ